MNKVFINGEYLNAADATISIFDRGFLFGDSVYEVLPVYNGQPYFVDRHIDRLRSNLEKIKIEMPNYSWHQLITQLIDENGGDNLQVYIQVTRGNQGIRKHDIPKSLDCTVVAFTIHNAYPTMEEKEKGLSAKLIDDNRWMRCDIKTTSLLPNVMLNDDALSSGYQTSILVRDGLITEGSTSNIFIVDQGGSIKTPPLTHHCLPGITRQVAIGLIKETDWNFNEEPIDTDALFAAQEVWITSTTKEIFPVTQINNRVINDGKAGCYWRTINKLYQQLLS